MTDFCAEKSVWYGTSRVVENCRVADETYRLSLKIHEPLPEIRPGQFVMLRLPNHTDPLLGRPLAIYRVETNAGVSLLEVVYIVVGRMTAKLAAVSPGTKLSLWAPLGNGFSTLAAPEKMPNHTIMVAGGIGQTPFFMLAESLLCKPQSHSQQNGGRCTLLYGAKTKARLACVDDFQRLLVDVHIATDDGSQGYHGRVTDLIADVCKPSESTQILCCGPKPMLRSAFNVAKTRQLPCYVSLETPMSCGLGICYGCVVPYRVESDMGEVWDYRRTCTDGPVFDAYRLRW